MTKEDRVNENHIAAVVLNQNFTFPPKSRDFSSSVLWIITKGLVFYNFFSFNILFYILVINKLLSLFQ